MSNYEVITKTIESQLVAATLGVIPNFDDCAPTIESKFDLVYGYVFSQGIKEINAGINIYHETKLRDRNIPIETVVPITRSIPSSDRVWIYELPEIATVACTVHQGEFETIGQAYNALLAWISKHEYQIAGSTREVYLRYERDGDPAQYVTEIQIPIAC